MPGAIRIHRDPASTVNFKCLGTYQSFNKIPSLEVAGIRATKLGLNIYSTSTSSSNNKQQNNKAEIAPPADSKVCNCWHGNLFTLSNMLMLLRLAVVITYTVTMYKWVFGNLTSWTPDYSCTLQYDDWWLTRYSPNSLPVIFAEVWTLKGKG